MMYSRECLYDLEWQKLRVGMLGTWTTVPQVKMNIYVLRCYLEGGSDVYERATRCSNYMAAISLGYGNKPEWAEQKALVTSAQVMFANVSPIQQNADWDWEAVREQLRKELDKQQLLAINADLKKRIATSTKRTGGVQHRPELMTFVRMLMAELSSRGLLKDRIA